MKNDERRRDYIGEVLAGEDGIEKMLLEVPLEERVSVERFLTWIVRSGSAWHNLSLWRWDVRTEAFVRADRDGVEFL